MSRSTAGKVTGITGLRGVNDPSTSSAGSRTPTQRVRDKNTDGAGRGSGQVYKSRCKPGCLFFVTLSLDEVYQDVRKDFLLSFNNIVTFCVAVEESKVSNKVSYHLHAFLEFASPCYVGDLREYISVVFDGLRCDVQPCRSKKSCLKYISKEDRDLFYNCKLSLLHFNYRAYYWAVNSDSFSFCDSFVMEHRFCYKFLQSLYNDVKKIKYRFVNFRVHDMLYGLEWVDKVVLWWNSFIKSSGYKRQQLYLWGPSNVGKSSFIERLIGKVNMPYVFYPDAGNFSFGDFDPAFHQVVLFEEFSLGKYDISLLKRLLEGRVFAASVKGSVPKYIKFTGPVIFVSNFGLNCEDQALINRLLFVNADVSFWSYYEANEALPLPKEEVSEEEDAVSVVSISSDSSGHDTVN